MLIFPVRNGVPSPSCLVEGHLTQPGECASHTRIPNAQDLYAGPCILWTSGALQEVYQGVCQYSVPLYDMLGKEVKMGPVDLPPKAREAVAILKGKVQSAPVLVFPDFEKPFLLETDASKEGLGAVLSQRCAPPSWKKGNRVVDGTILNAHMKKDSYPLPWIQEALESQGQRISH